MKNIIITFHDEMNYGAALQTYALFNVLSRLGETKVLNYSIKKKTNFSLSYIIRSFFPFSIIRKYRFKKFINNNICLTKKVKSISSVEDACSWADNIICGSDQIWAFDITKESKDIYLVNFNSNANIISYAASFGKEIIPISDKKYLIESLKKFNRISVRETSAKSILNDYYDVDVVLDPTLLLDLKDWKKILNISKINEKYVLIYMLEHDDELIKVALDVGNALNMKILFFNGINRFGSKGINKSCSGPKEFVEYFYNASFIITNSFHGLSFAINFNKQFICFLHKTKNTRQKNLLSITGLENRIYSSKNNLGYYLDNIIDYRISNKLLAAERKKAITYINNSLISEHIKKY